MSKIKHFIIMVWNDFIHIFIDNNPHYYVNAKTYERFLEWEQFCNNNNCLARNIKVNALAKFRIYIEDLEKSIFNFNDCHKTPEDFLRDLKTLYAEMR